METIFNFKILTFCIIVGILAGQALFLGIKKEMKEIKKITFTEIAVNSVFPIVGAILISSIGYLALS